jgi:NADPH:quinone reductase-like Zn-dependent oxidoreductase
VIKASALIVPVPDGMEFTHAAAVPVSGNTALRAIRALPRGHGPRSLFIAGASGAVGTFAIQIAGAQGWRVAASASPANHAYLLGLGADLAVDYRDSGWADEVRQWAPGGVDAAIAIQPDTTTDSMAVVRDGGAVVTVSNDRVDSARGIQAGGVPHDVDMRADLAQLVADVVGGRVHLEIEHVYPFADARSALAKVQTRHARGKLVLQMP